VNLLGPGRLRHHNGGEVEAATMKGAIGGGRLRAARTELGDKQP